MLLDTDVVVAAIRSDTGASNELVRRAVQREVAIELSVAMVLEYEAVAMRPEHLAVGHKSHHDVMLVIDALVASAEPIDVHFRWRPQLRDPDDEMVFEAAINAADRTIVTFNKRDFVGAADRFRVRVVTPREVLESGK